MYKWNDNGLRKKYERIETEVLESKSYDATEETVETPTLESWKFKTKSVRIWSMIHLAYQLGRMRAIKDIDGGKTPVTMS